MKLLIMHSSPSLLFLPLSYVQNILLSILLSTIKGKAVPVKGKVVPVL
jgi:hypothetical protein